MIELWGRGIFSNIFKLQVQACINPSFAMLEWLGSTEFATALQSTQIFSLHQQTSKKWIMKPKPYHDSRVNTIGPVVFYCIIHVQSQAKGLL